MRPVGPILKRYIEEQGLKKVDVAEKLGITNNYLSTIFMKMSIDAELLERACRVLGLSPMTFFELEGNANIPTYSDINAKTVIGTSSVQIRHGDMMNERIIAEKERIIEEKNKLIEEKERTIQILMAANGFRSETAASRDNE